jgi:hypothetical protein
MDPDRRQRVLQSGDRLRGESQPRPSESKLCGHPEFHDPAAGGSVNGGLQVGITHRLSQNLSAQVAYTYARLKDSTTGPFYYPNNQMDLNSEWATSPDNQTHTLTIGASYLWKWGISLSGGYHYGSGQNFQVTANQNPFNATGVADRLFPAAEAYYTSPSNVPPVTVGGVNYLLLKRDSLVGNAISRVDMRLSKTFTVKERTASSPWWKRLTCSTIRISEAAKPL